IASSSSTLVTASVATSASGRGISIPFDLRVPAEGPHHGVAVDPEGREPQPELALRQVRTVLGVDPGRRHLLDRPVHLHRHHQPLARAHPAILFYEPLLDLSWSIGRLGAHGLPILRPFARLEAAAGGGSAPPPATTGSAAPESLPSANFSRSARATGSCEGLIGHVEEMSI